MNDIIKAVPRWRHSITLPDGTSTKGAQDSQDLLRRLQLPEDLSGRTVLDIGCSDGFYSFECERRGATSVVAVDNYSTPSLFYSPSGFHAAHEAFKSKVDFRQIDFFDLDADADGPFDIVLFMGVLYHLRHPLLGLEKVASLCRGKVILETRLDSPFGLWGAVKRRLFGPDNRSPSMRFCEGSEVNNDPSNWWMPTAKCVEAMMRSCGFRSIKQVDQKGWRGIFHGEIDSP